MYNDNEDNEIIVDEYDDPQWAKSVKNFFKDIVFWTLHAPVTTIAFLFYVMALGTVHIDTKLKNIRKRWRNGTDSENGDTAKSRQSGEDIADSLDESALEVTHCTEIEGEGGAYQMVKPQEDDEQSIQSPDAELEEDEVDTGCSATEQEESQTPHSAAGACRQGKRNQRRRDRNNIKTSMASR